MKTPKHEPARPPVDPDPKAHPVHREPPPFEPIQQGTDPRQPVTEGPSRPSER